ncbi:hypothetical protein [Streptomyces griseoluteus]|uniref:hypothetical protein n=1 Tax=Streptomyces griseoluteus TaxID=29306 RepID=UPI0036FE3A82
MNRFRDGAGLPPEAQAPAIGVVRRAGHRRRRATGLLRAPGAEAVDVRGGTRERAAAGPPVAASEGRNGTVT